MYIIQTTVHPSAFHIGGKEGKCWIVKNHTCLDGTVLYSGFVARFLDRNDAQKKSAETQADMEEFCAKVAKHFKQGK
jgi:hypothetical protein